MWDTKYRPLVFDDVLGQEGSIQVLSSRLRKGEAFDTSYIFSGGHGSGKTSLARLLSRAMLCQNLQEDGNPCNSCEHCLACLNETMVAFTEMDAASQGTTADMRRIVENLGYSIPGVKKKIYLLDEAHRMSRDAQDVLLKPIEDKRVVFIFCTTEFSKIRDTIKSRCEAYEIRRIQLDDILARARDILEREQVSFEEDAVRMVIDYCRGHVRDVLNRLETISQLGPITVDAVRERLDLSVVSLYYEILLALGDPARSVALIEDACDRTSPSRVVTGLAEAAMNSFRQANQIHVDHSQLDREGAAAVYDRFQESTIDLARYFLKMGPHTSSLDLVCGAVAFKASGSGVPAPEPVRLANPPVRLVTTPAPVANPPLRAVEEPSKPSEEVRQEIPTQEPKPAETPPSEPAEIVPVEDYRKPLSAVDAEALAAPTPLGFGSWRKSQNQSEKKIPRVREAGTSYTREEFTSTFHSVLKELLPHGG